MIKQIQLKIIIQYTIDWLIADVEDIFELSCSTFPIQNQTNQTLEKPYNQPKNIHSQFEV